MSATEAPVARVVLDCDGGIDDALALMYLCALHVSKEIVLAGVTTTAGSTTARQAALNAAWVMEACGVDDVPVAAGRPEPRYSRTNVNTQAHGVTGLGDLIDYHPNAAVVDDWLAVWRRGVDGAQSAGADSHLVVTGPCTNLVEHTTALQEFTTVTMMGGAYNYAGNTTPSAERNFWVDPYAAKLVFAAATPDCPVTDCPLNVTDQSMFTHEDLVTLITALGSTPLAEDLPAIVGYSLRYHDVEYGTAEAHLHDLVTVMVAMETIDSEFVETTVDVEETSRLMRGTSVADFWGVWDRAVNARVVIEADAAGVTGELLRSARILAAANRARR